MNRERSADQARFAGTQCTAQTCGVRRSLASILPPAIGREAADPHNEPLPINLALLLTCYERDPAGAPLTYSEGGLKVTRYRSDPSSDEAPSEIMR